MTIEMPRSQEKLASMPWDSIFSNFLRVPSQTPLLEEAGELFRELRTEVKKNDFVKDGVYNNRRREAALRKTAYEVAEARDWLPEGWIKSIPIGCKSDFQRKFYSITRSGSSRAEPVVYTEGLGVNSGTQEYPSLGSLSALIANQKRVKEAEDLAAEAMSRMYAVYGKPFAPVFHWIGISPSVMADAARSNTMNSNQSSGPSFPLESLSLPRKGLIRPGGIFRSIINELSRERSLDFNSNKDILERCGITSPAPLGRVQVGLLLIYLIMEGRIAPTKNIYDVLRRHSSLDSNGNLTLLSDSNPLDPVLRTWSTGHGVFCINDNGIYFVTCELSIEPEPTRRS